jgi:hypothetical protein
MPTYVRKIELHTLKEVKLTEQDGVEYLANNDAKMKALAASLKEQASQIEKVSDQLEASKPAPQVVTNP